MKVEKRKGAVRVKKKKKIFSLLMAFTLLLNLFLPTGKVFAMENNTDVIDDTVITELKVLDVEKSQSNVTIGANGQKSFEISTMLSGSRKDEVWLGYRFTLPENSASGGTWGFVNNSYAWLLDLTDTNKQAQVKKENGNVIIEGKVLAKNPNGGNIVPGAYIPTITVSSSKLVNDEKAELKVESWVIGKEDDSKSATATLIAKTSFDYNIVNNGPTGSMISGYFNKKTGDFTLDKPKNMDGYVYGRVYSQIIYATPENGDTERIDPTKPLSFDFSYSVVKNQNGASKVENEEKYMPILMAVKQPDIKIKNSQLNGTPPIKDVTLGGLIDDVSSYYDPTNNDYYRGGDYTFTEKDKKVTVSAILSKDNKNSRYVQAAAMGLFFVPLNENDPKGLTRELQLKCENIQGTTYSGNKINDVTENPYIIKITVAPKGGAEGEGGQGYLSREIVLADASGSKTSVVSKNGKLVLFSKVKSMIPEISDAKTNAVNVLVKFEAGLELTHVRTYDTNNGKQYTGDVNFLYATKLDGTAWKDEIEINHTQDYELVYYNDLNTAKQKGQVVGVLVEYRNGVWRNGDLNLSLELKANGESGKSYVTVQDVKVWREDTKNTSSWKDTNGAKVSQDIEPSDFLKPYDNPDNTLGDESVRVYRRDEWPNGSDRPVEREGSTWGDTVYILGGTIKTNKDTSKNLNGNNISSLHGAYNETWSNSTFDIGLNQRVIDRTFGFTVTGMNDTNLSLSVDLDRKCNGLDNNLKDYLNIQGEVRLSTPDNPVTYVKHNDSTQQGEFQGGVVIDPANFTVPGDGEYQIYYKSIIGDMSDISKDPLAGVIWNDSAIKLLPDSAKDAFVQSDKVSYATTIVKTSSKGVSKKPISQSAKDEVGYQLVMTSNRTEEKNTFILDVLPYNGDGRGTNYNGSYSLKNNRVTVKYSGLSDNIKSSGKIFYTTDSEVRDNGNGSYDSASIFRGMQVDSLVDGFQAGGSTWKLAKDNNDGTWSVPEDVVPTAILACGSVGADERLAIDIILSIKDNKVGDVYNNVSSSVLTHADTALDSNIAKVQVATRSISGKAWEDTNKNGIYEDGVDRLLENVGVQLYKADGSQIKKDANGEKYGEVKTAVDGTYTFDKIPENADGYYIRFVSTDNFDIDQYFLTQKNADGAKTPYEKDNDSDVQQKGKKSIYAETDIFTLYTDDELVNLGITDQKASGVNAGFYSGYNVTYEFVSETQDKALPQEVLDLLPRDENKYKHNAKVTAKKPEKTKIDVADGVWKFKGYDADEKEATSDIKFLGTWEFILSAIPINHVPTINATDKVLTVGDKFNPLDGVTAYDREDGEIKVTESDVIVNDVNMNQAGTYTVTYKVTDSKGASVVKTITVVVNPKMEELNHVPTINATDKVLTVGDKFNPLDGVTAYDREDGEIKVTESDVIVNDVNTDQAGTYTVTYKVTDSKGASTIKTINVTVKAKDTDKTITTEKPNKSDKSNSNPKTGDSKNIEFYVSMVGLSTLILTILLLLKKKTVRLKK